MKKAIILLLCLGLVGCASSIKVNTGILNKTYPSKPNDYEIILTTQDIDRQYKEIAVISVRGGDNDTYD